MSLSACCSRGHLFAPDCCSRSRACTAACPLHIRRGSRTALEMCGFVWYTEVQKKRNYSQPRSMCSSHARRLQLDVKLNATCQGVRMMTDALHQWKLLHNNDRRRRRDKTDAKWRRWMVWLLADLFVRGWTVIYTAKCHPSKYLHTRPKHEKMFSPACAPFHKMFMIFLRCCTEDYISVELTEGGVSSSADVLQHGGQEWRKLFLPHPSVIADLPQWQRIQHSPLYRFTRTHLSHPPSAPHHLSWNLGGLKEDMKH